MSAILFDLDGVIYQGDTAIDGAVATVHWCQAHAIPHLFVTNTSSIPRSAIVNKLAALGITTSAESVFTPAAATVQWLESHITGAIALFVAAATVTEFAHFSILDERAESGAAAIVVGDLGAEWNFDKLNRAFRLLNQAPPPPLLALGMTRYWRTPSGLNLDVGPFVKALEFAAGVEAVVLGKPAVALFDTAVATLGADPAATWMIGDDLHGDIEGAQQAGLKAILVKTGKFRPADLAQAITPDAILDSAADLPRWWSAQGL